MTTETLLTPDEAADRKNVSRQTIYTAIRRRHLTGERRYGRLVVSVSELDAWTPASPSERGRRGMAARMAKSNITTAPNAPTTPTETADKRADGSEGKS